MNNRDNKLKSKNKIYLTETALFTAMLLGVNSFASTLVEHEQTISKLSDQAIKLSTLCATGGLLIGSILLLIGFIKPKNVGSQ